MTDQPGPAKAADPLPTDIPPPAGLTALCKRLGPGWEHRATYSRGTIVRQTVDPDLRRRVQVDEACESYGLRLQHDLACAYAVWVRREGRTKWSFDHARTWTLCVDRDCPSAHTAHPGDVPAPVGARELTAWVDTIEQAVDDEEVAA